MYDSANKCNIWETRSLSIGVWSVLYEVMCTDAIWESKEITSLSNFFYLQNIVIKCDTGMYSEISIKLWSKMRFGVEIRWTNTAWKSDTESMGIGIGFDLIGVYNVEHNITSYETGGICDVFQ